MCTNEEVTQLMRGPLGGSRVIIVARLPHFVEVAVRRQGFWIVLNLA